MAKINPIARAISPFVILFGIFLGSWTAAHAVSAFITGQGGTGTTSPSGILYGDNGSTTHLNTVTIGTNLTFSSGTLSATGGSGTVSTSSSETATYVPVWSTTAGTPAKLTGGSSALVVSGGNVGIGTSTPATNLQVYADNEGLRLGTNSTNNSWLGFQYNGTADRALVGYNNASFGSDGGFAYIAGGIAGKGVGFAVNGNGAGSPSMYINSSGNVGIGTTSPAWLLSTSKSTGGQFHLGNGSLGMLFSQYTDGSFAMATTNPTTYATSSVAALQIDKNGYLISPILSGTPAGAFLAVDPNGKIIATTTPSGGAVSSVSNSDGTLTISPTTGAVVGSLNLGHANIWSALQTYSAGILSTASSTIGGGTSSTGLTINGNATSTGNVLIQTGKTGTTTLEVGDSTHPGCIGMEDMVTGAMTYISVRAGTLYASTVSCE